MQAVPADDWKLCESIDANRRARLLGSTLPEELLERICAEAKKQANRNYVKAEWKRSNDQAGHCRVECTIPLSRSTFDLFFNGRMGYRAQYYHSVDEGRAFNRQLINFLTPVIKPAREKNPSITTPWGIVVKSLEGPYSKVWVAGDWAVFMREPKILLPARWVACWSTCSDEEIGLCAPLPECPELDLKGTFIHEQTQEPWLPSSKRDRDEKIYCCGWT